MPPEASLAAADGSAVVGRIGSYNYCQTAADGLPPRAASLTAVGLGDPPTVQLSVMGPDLITGYRATYWTASEWQGDEMPLANETFAAPAAAISFDGPPAGEWMLSVLVSFASGGDSLYYWHVLVP